MPIDWQSILQLAPLAMAKPGSPHAAAVLQGYQQSMQRLQQERERREGVASQQAQQAWQRQVQERQLSMQAQQHEAQLQNTQADNTRADQAELRQKHQDALARLSQGIGAFTPAINQIAETATDPVQAENALLQRSSAIGSAYGLDPSALSGFIPPMAPMISAKKKKRAETMYADAEKRYNVKDKDGNSVNPEWDSSITLQTGDLFGDVTPSQLLEMFSAPAVDASGQPARRPRVPSKSATPGSFEEYIDADPARQALIEGARKRYQQADDRPSVNISNGGPGWTIQPVTDPATNKVSFLRVNSRTGEVHPVEIPGGLQPGKSRLTAGQQDDLATMETIEDMAADVLKLGEQTKWAGVGGMGKGRVKQFGARQFGAGTAEDEALRNFIGNIQGTIAKLRGGTSFTENEQKLLEQYTPTINEDKMAIRAKLKSLTHFIQYKRKNSLKYSGAGPVAPSDAPAAPGSGSRDPMGLR